MTAWFYHQLVLRPRRGVEDGETTGFTSLTPDEFVKCMQSLSANVNYVSWLRGQFLNEYTRVECFNKIKEAISFRIRDERGKRAKLPDPEWAHKVRRPG